MTIMQLLSFYPTRFPEPTFEMIDSLVHPSIALLIMLFNDSGFQSQSSSRRELFGNISRLNYSSTYNIV